MAMRRPLSKKNNAKVNTKAIKETTEELEDEDLEVTTTKKTVKKSPSKKLPKKVEEVYEPEEEIDDDDIILDEEDEDDEPEEKPIKKTTKARKVAEEEDEDEDEFDEEDDDEDTSEDDSEDEDEDSSDDESEDEDESDEDEDDDDEDDEPEKPIKKTKKKKAEYKAEILGKKVRILVPTEDDVIDTSARFASAESLIKIVKKDLNSELDLEMDNEGIEALILTMNKAYLKAMVAGYKVPFLNTTISLKKVNPVLYKAFGENMKTDVFKKDHYKISLNGGEYDIDKGTIFTNNGVSELSTPVKNNGDDTYTVLSDTLFFKEGDVIDEEGKKIKKTSTSKKTTKKSIKKKK